MQSRIRPEWIILALLPLLVWVAFSVKTINYDVSGAPSPFSVLGDSSKSCIKATKADTIAFPALFEAAFDTTTRLSDRGQEYHFRIYDAGLLFSHTGKLIVGDPVTASSALALCDTFPIGSFDVELAMVNAGMAECVVMSRVKFSEKPVHRWSMAYWPGGKPRAVSDSIVNVFTVDGGLAMIADSVSNVHLQNHFDQYMDDVFMSRGRLQNLPGHTLYFDRYTVTSFQTAGGDGRYCAYVGRDAEGKICRLLIDFGFFNW
jgi:hypothetical protein